MSTAAWLRSELAIAEEKLRRLYRLVEIGEDEPDDLLKERLSAVWAEQELTKAALGRIRDAGPGPAKISPEAIERLMREHVTSGEIPFRRRGFRRSSTGWRSERT